MQTVLVPKSLCGLNRLSYLITTRWCQIYLLDNCGKGVTVQQ